jgi:putative heme-binding domain-containing protein
MDESRPSGERVGAVRLLGSGRFEDVVEPLKELLLPRHAEPIQIAAIQALDALANPGVVELLVESWRRFLPSVKEQALDVLCGRKDRLSPLLEAIEKGRIPADQFDSIRRARILAFPDRDIAEKAKGIFQEPKTDPKLFDDVKGALDLQGNADRGTPIFNKLCLSCHRAGGQGTAVGPNLTIVRDNPPEQILKNILYPSLVVAPTFVQYIVETKDGQVLSGIIAEAQGTSLTLRRPGVGDAHLLRKDIRNLVSSQVSLMPEGLLKGLAHQEVADLLKFVREIK